MTTEPITPERLAEIRTWLDDRTFESRSGFAPIGVHIASVLLDEVDRLSKAATDSEEILVSLRALADSYAGPDRVALSWAAAIRRALGEESA